MSNTSAKLNEKKHSPISYKITVCDDDLLAVNVLTDVVPISKQKIKDLMKKGAVWLEQAGAKPRRLRRSKKKLRKGDILHCHYNPAVIAMPSLEANLIFDAGSYSIWGKPTGMFSQGSKWGDHCSISRYVETHLKPERPAFLVHRLDRATSGLMVIAHSKKMAAIFSSLFEKRLIHKNYLAAIKGDCRSLFSSTENTSSQTTNNTPSLCLSMPIDGKHAITHIALHRYDAHENITWLSINLETGRKHQIRKHLASIQHPIIGDRLYGNATQKSPNLQLQASHLHFICPISNTAVNFNVAQRLDTL